VLVSFLHLAMNSSLLGQEEDLCRDSHVQDFLAVWRE
jgi:hypothetical protein